MMRQIGDRKRPITACFLCFLILSQFSLFISCRSGLDSESQQSDSGIAAGTSGKTGEDRQVVPVLITVQDRNYQAVLYQNETTSALLELMPMILPMQDQYGACKSYVLPYWLPVNPQKIQEVHPGELMLYEGDRLMLFYEGFSGTYQYTPLGYIETPSDLAEIFGDSDALVTFAPQS